MRIVVWWRGITRRYRAAGMDPTSFLESLERQSHTERMRRMVDLGRRAAADPSIAALLATLNTGGFSARLLALQSCAGSGDAVMVARALADRSRLIRGRAIVLAPFFCDDGQLLAAL